MMGTDQLEEIKRHVLKSVWIVFQPLEELQYKFFFSISSVWISQHYLKKNIHSSQ